jgi:predicted PurR-regulated permease PerM
MSHSPPSPPIDPIDQDRLGDGYRDDRFMRRLLAVVLVAIAIVIVWRLSAILVIVFGAVLLSLVLRGLAGKLGAAFGIGTDFAIGVVVLALVVLLSLFAWLFGSQVHDQFVEIAKQLPQIVDQLMARINQEPLGQSILQHVGGFNFSGATGAAASGVAHVATSLSSGLGFLVLAFFTGIYIAFQPGRYRRGLITLVPPRHRDRAREFLEVAGTSLQRWLLAQFVVMVFVGTCVGFGLSAIGVKGALALGLLDGLFSFVPVIGPLVACVPAILLALAHSPLLALYTVALYLGVHMIEGYLVTPLIQSHALSLPPVITLFAAIAFGTLLGPLAVLFAAPLAVLVMVAFGVFYVEGILGEKRTWPPA